VRQPLADGQDAANGCALALVSQLRMRDLRRSHARAELEGCLVDVCLLMGKSRLVIHDGPFAPPGGPAWMTECHSGKRHRAAPNCACKASDRPKAWHGLAVGCRGGGTIDIDLDLDLDRDDDRDLDPAIRDFFVRGYERGGTFS
jgi:hypothetical protein